MKISRSQCYHCNLHKGPNLSGIDQESGALVRLFNPREDKWDDHFEQNGVVIVRHAHGQLPTPGNDPARIEELRLKTLQPYIIRGDSGERHLSDEAFPFGEFISDKKGKVGSYSPPSWALRNAFRVAVRNASMIGLR